MMFFFLFFFFYIGILLILLHKSKLFKLKNVSGFFLFVFKSLKCGGGLQPQDNPAPKPSSLYCPPPLAPCSLTPSTHILSVAVVIKLPTLSQHTLQPPLRRDQREEAGDVRMCLCVNEKFGRHAEIKWVAVVC